MILWGFFLPDSRNPTGNSFRHFWLSSYDLLTVEFSKCVFCSAKLSYFCCLFVNRGLHCQSQLQTLQLPLCRHVKFSKGQGGGLAWVWAGSGYLWSFGLGFFLFSISATGCGIPVPDCVPEEDYESCQWWPKTCAHDRWGLSLPWPVSAQRGCGRAASSALQGLGVGSTKKGIYLFLYSWFPLTPWLTPACCLLWRVIWATKRWSVQHQGNWDTQLSGRCAWEVVNSCPGSLRELPWVPQDPFLLLASASCLMHSLF